MIEAFIDSENSKCPHCSTAMSDTWELFFDADFNDIRKRTCDTCGKIYNVERRVIVDYISTLIED